MLAKLSFFFFSFQHLNHLHDAYLHKLNVIADMSVTERGPIVASFITVAVLPLLGRIIGNNCISFL